MAEVADLLYQDQLRCIICLGLLKDPVTIICGHSYCMGCIKRCWDQDDHTGVYSCPQCRQTFTPRPVLNKNTILAKMMEKAKGRELCPGRKRRSVESELVCLSSRFETQLKLRNDLSSGKRHKLRDASENQQEKICFHHDKLLEVYCRTDRQFICLLCVMGEHQGHDTVSASTERTEKQKQLGATQSKFQQRIQEKEKELQDLRQAVQSLKLSAQAAVGVTEGLQEITEREIAELKRRNAELEQLSQTEDHIHFLQSFKSICDHSGPEFLPSITINSHVTFEAARQSVSDVKELVENILKRERGTEIPKTVKVVKMAEPKTRKEFLQYSCQLTLDPNTADQFLSLSEENREVTYVEKYQSYPDHPERFDSRAQVLCREGLSGRCYWEAEWDVSSFNNELSIAVSYKDIRRKGIGYGSRLGYNHRSWSLQCSPSSCNFRHNNKMKNIDVIPSFIIGVYLDHRAGTLSFYSVSDTMTLLHRVQTTFTQPLYPAFGLNWMKSASVKLCNPV